MFFKNYQNLSFLKNTRVQINSKLNEKIRMSTFYCSFHKHANSKAQKPPSQLRFSLPSIIITNLETQKHTKRIEIHQSHIIIHDLLNPLK